MDIWEKSVQLFDIQVYMCNTIKKIKKIKSQLLLQPISICIVILYMESYHYF